MTVTWDTDRPAGDWQNLGGSFPPSAVTVDCEVCGIPAGTFCHYREFRYPEPCAATGWMGVHVRAPSIHLARWGAMNARAQAARKPAVGQQLTLG
jgi:hypothetical protein